jgi:hypothetical protein
MYKVNATGRFQSVVVATKDTYNRFWTLTNEVYDCLPRPAHPRQRGCLPVRTVSRVLSVLRAARG